MSYQVLARKWRPQTFEQIVGQEHVTTTLSNALQRDRVAHAYLFTGPRGCGKTTMARLLAKALNCEAESGAPCGECDTCRSIADGNFLDVMEIDAASHTGVDNIRELRENAQYQPTSGKKRVFIIDEVHMLSKGAFNALLKILEEPPAHVHFVFATTEPVRIPRTILSRCQRFDFRLFSMQELVGRLRAIAEEEGIALAPDAIELLASLAEGSMRDALSLFDQAIASTEGEITGQRILELFGLVGHEVYLDLNRAVLERDPRAALDLVDGLVRAGHDLVEFARGIVADFRDLALVRLDPALAERIDKPEAVRTRLVEQAKGLAVVDWVELTQRAAEHYSALERAPQPRWLLEAQVVEYATFESRVLLSELLGRLEALGSGDGGPAPTGKGARRPAVGAPASAPRSPSASSSAAPPPTRAAARVDARSDRPAPAGETAAPDPAPDSGTVPPSSAAGEPWTRFLARMREVDLPVATCLMEAVPRAVDDELHLVFRPEHEFHRDHVAQARVVTTIAAVAAEIWGRPLRIEVEVDVPAEEEARRQRLAQQTVAPDRAQRLRREAQENPHLGRLLDSLGGETEEA